MFGVDFFFFSIQFSCSVVFDSLPPHEQRHAKVPCPSPDPGVWISFLWCWIYFFTCLIHLFQMPVFYSHTSHLNNFHQELYASTILCIWTFSQSIISPLSPNFAYVLNSTQNSFLYLKKTNTSSHPSHAQSHFWLFSSVIPTQFLLLTFLLRKLIK